MQAAIVAGGRGERMRPATDLTPKPLLSLAGKPLLVYQLEWLAASGVRDVSLCIGYKAEAFEKALGDGARWGLRLRYCVEKEPRGTAGAVKDLRPSGDLLVVYGDLFVSMDAQKLFAFHGGHDGQATLVARRTDHPHDSDLLECDGASVKRVFRSKTVDEAENLACAAVWVVRPALLDLVPAGKPSDFAKDTFPAALAAGRKLAAYETTEEVVDLGTPERHAAFEKRRGARA